MGVRITSLAARLEPPKEANIQMTYTGVIPCHS